MEPVIKLENITKRYGKQTVVDKANITIEKGHIYGLIGPNGAGKTTIMKILAGLALQDEGEVSFFGRKDALDENRARMSFMIEAPFLDETMSARQNMEYVRFVRGIAEEKRIDEMLAFVGLENVGKKPAGKFSLGMKQRLGLAMALLSEPEVMVLDEPVNGLDPEGIVELRQMLKKLCQEEGITIMISSHILSELAELCTDYIIISQGKIVEKLSAEELNNKCRQYIAIKTNNISETATVLEQTLKTTNYKVVEDEEIHLYDMLEELERVSKAITDNGLIITKFVSVGEELENYYLSKVGGSHE
ncbi:MAG: ATP-binding cassette domain-containing protein [Lachnospiraceae bacterium]|nr:ATP-binding cassette domain-containing protein [Lachnospiraceae bacterium]